ncbi:hypothetical protein [Streptomyces platensis]|uniref:hypothetical protein n=1 Tax=Streptomyces platensis TaxID=58346 RepID=UPI00332C7A88
MNRRPELTSEIHDLADELTGCHPALDAMVRAALDLHYDESDAIHLSAATTRIAGQDSLLALFALVLEGKAEAKPINDLPAGRRHKAKAALHQLTAQISATANSGHAETAAYNLDPA